MKLELPVPFFALEEVAERWGRSVAELLAMASAGRLEIETEMLAGEQRAVIRAAERERIEATYTAKAKTRPTAAIRADARQSYEDVIACLLALYFGDDPATLRPYERAHELQRFAARIGLPMTRTERKYAAIMRAAGDRLRACGFLTEPAPEPQEAPQDNAAKAKASTSTAQRIEQPKAANAR